MRRRNALLIAFLLSAGCDSRALESEAEALLARHPQGLSHTELSRFENVRVNTGHEIVCGRVFYRGDGIMGDARREEEILFVYQRHRNPLFEFSDGKRVTARFHAQWQRCEAG